MAESPAVARAACTRILLSVPMVMRRPAAFPDAAAFLATRAMSGLGATMSTRSPNGRGGAVGTVTVKASTDCAVSALSALVCLSRQRRRSLCVATMR